MTEPHGTTLTRMQNPRYRGWVLAVFTLVALFGFADRQILSSLGQAIKHDLGVTDTQFGLLSGLAFAFLNSLLAIPIARFADKGRRVRIIAVGVVLWSMATSVCGLALSFVQLMAARVFVGVGEATGAPATTSVIADYFPRDKRATAMAIFGLAIPLGALLGQAGGGFIAQHFDWRSAFVIAGLPGLVLAALLALTVKEPLRGQYDAAPNTGDATPSLTTVLKRMVARRSFLHTALGSTIVSAGGFGIITFQAQYFFRRFGLGYADAGLVTGLVSAVPGCICILGAGFVADWLGRRDARFYGWVPALGALLAAPGYMLSFAQGGWPVTMALLMLTGIAQYAYLPISGAIYQNVMEPRMRASAAAVVAVMTNLVSASVGPLAVGALSDYFTNRAFARAGGGDFPVACAGARAAQTSAEGACGQASAAGLQTACILFALIYLWGAVHFLLAARTLKRDMA